MSPSAPFNRWNPQSLSSSFRLRLGTLLVLLSAIGFSAKGILAKLVYHEGLNSSTVLSLRMLSVLPIYLAGLFLFGDRSPHSRPGPSSPDFWKVVMLGILGFDVSAALDFEGLMHIRAGLERLVLFLYPTFVVFLSSALFRRGIALREILSAVLAYVGLAIMTGGGMEGKSEERMGVGLVLGSGMIYAIYLVGVEQVLRRVNPMYLTSLVMVVATAAILLQSILSGTFHPERINARGLLAIGTMGVFSTALPTFFMTMGIALIGASRAALLSFAGPLVTLFMASVFLGERMNLREWVGSILLLVGVCFVALRADEKKFKKTG